MRQLDLFHNGSGGATARSWRLEGPESALSTGRYRHPVSSRKNEALKTSHNFLYQIVGAEMQIIQRTN
jgi:hypothetical protein